MAPHAIQVGLRCATTQHSLCAHLCTEGSSAMQSTDATHDTAPFLQRALSRTSNESGQDDLVLEVAHAWADTVLQVQHYGPSSAPVTAGTALGHRWRFMGVPLAWVPASFGHVSWLLGPTLSETQPEWRNDLQIPPEMLPYNSFPVFAWEDGECICHIGADWTGFVETAAGRVTLAELVRTGVAKAVEPGICALPLAPGARFQATLGATTLHARLVPRGDKVLAGRRDAPEAGFLGALGAASLMFASMATVVGLSSPDVEGEVFQSDDRLVQLVMSVPMPAPVPVAEAESGGPAAPEEAGKAGEPNAKTEVAQGAPRRHTTDREVVDSQGLLGALNDNASLAGLLGDSSLQDALTGGIGGAIGAKGVQLGSGGWSSRGTGLGGGGDAQNMGGLDGDGHGRDRGHGPGIGGGVTPKAQGRISAIPVNSVIMGALDKSLIDAVIKRHTDQIRHCYQRALPRHPDMSGKLTVRFVIAKDGSVSKSSIKNSSLGNGEVESCISSRFLRFKFPQPLGGGIVIVSYPFMFSAR